MSLNLESLGKASVMNDTRTVTKIIIENRRGVRAEESMLVAVSGIDGSGKGYITAKIVAGLRGNGVNTVGVNIDG